MAQKDPRGSASFRFRVVLGRLCIAIPALAASMLLVPEVSWATVYCNTMEYHYGGEESSSGYYQGIERYISSTTLTLSPGDSMQHILNWMGLASLTWNCYGGGQCWIQAGYGSGYVGGHPSAGTQQYMEEQDVNGQAVNWAPGNRTVASDNFYTVYYTQTWVQRSGGNLGLFDAFIIPNGQQSILAGQAWIPLNDVLFAEANAEMVKSNYGPCPTMAARAYYGAGHDGSYTGGTELALSVDGLNWAKWPTGHNVDITDINYYNRAYLDGPRVFWVYTR